MWDEVVDDLALAADLQAGVALILVEAAPHPAEEGAIPAEDHHAGAGLTRGVDPTTDAHDQGQGDVVLRATQAVVVAGLIPDRPQETNGCNPLARIKQT